MSVFCFILAVMFLVFGGVIIDTCSEGEERPDEAIVATLGSSVVLFVMAFAFCGC